MADKIFAERLKQVRNEKGYNQQYMAHSLEKSQPLYCQWENGQKEPGIKDLRRLSQILCVSLDWLIGTDEPKAPNPKRQ